MNRPRSGVALIIAISVLAALMFLALPFLYSQSASMAGAKSAAYDGEARRGQARAGNLGVSLAVYADALHVAPGYRLAFNASLTPDQLRAAALTYTQIGQIGHETRHPAYAADGQRLSVRTDLAWEYPAGQIVGERLDAADRPMSHGLEMEDQSWISGRVDPKTLDAKGWARLFHMAGIWDPITLRAGWVGDQTLNWTQNADGFGRLAYGLQQQLWANARILRRLEDLGSFDPQVIEPPPPPTGSGWTLPAAAVVTAQRDAAESDSPAVKDAANVGFRSLRLSRSEIESLRPYLSDGQAAQQIPAQARSGLIDLGNVVAAEHGQYVIDANQAGALVPGDRLRSASAVNGWVTGTSGVGLTVTADGQFQVGEGLGVAAIPPMNINAAPAALPMVRWFHDFWDSNNVFQGTGSYGWPTDPVAHPIHTLADLPELYLVDPRAGDGTTSYLRPPVSVTNWGIVAVTSAATVRDAQGRIQATRRQRAVVQALPQEHAIEARWETQADFEALVRQRHGSWVVAGPHPTNRIRNWGSDAADMAKLADPGWLEPAPMPSFSVNPALTFDWKATFGLVASTDWNAVMASAIAPHPDPRTALTPQGLRLVSGGPELAWTLAASGPPVVCQTNGDEMTARHVSMRFRLDAIASTPMDLLDVRGDASTAETGRWRVWYDPTPGSEMLVLGIANAALPWHGQATAWSTGTDTAGSDEDQRCVPGSYDFAPAWPAQRVEFRYKAKLETGRWYHLQAWSADDRPGHHGLILDGVVGRDAFVAGAFSQLGDHYTFPSLRLLTSINAVAVDDGVDLAPFDVECVPPPDLTVSDVLPTRGLVRIGDEYLSYDVIDGNFLRGVQRGRRVQTWQDSANAAENWPVTQAHATGAVVLPGWCQAVLSGPWSTGAATMQQQLPVQATMQFTSANPGVITVAVPADWPACGQLAVDTSANLAWFRKVGNDLRLQWIGASAAPVGVSVPVWVTSLQVDTVAGFPPSGHLQLLDAANGRCEWITYDGLVTSTVWTDDNGTPADTTDDVPVPLAGSALFLSQTGWDMAPFIAPAPPQPMAQPRGAMRTPIRPGVWPALTTVLPVQDLSGAHRMESGDVVTLVPAPGSTSFAPVQVVVRHAARDGYPDDGVADASWEVDSTSFALTTQAPVGVGGTVIALIGRGWNGADLSVQQAQTARRGRMPTITDMGANPRLVVGSADMTVDDLCAGILRGVQLDLNRHDEPGRVVDVFTRTWNATTTTWDTLIQSSISTLPVRVLTGPGFVWTAAYGLADFDGEVFAYRRIADQEIELFARGQVGSVITDHAAAIAGGTATIMPLPMGPVAELASHMTGPGFDVLDIDALSYFRDAADVHPGELRYNLSQFAAPAALVSAHDGSQSEVLMMSARPFGNQRVTAPWLRGLYGSTSPSPDWKGEPLVTNRPASWTDWSPSANPPPVPLELKTILPANPVVIGWWPRFAPGLPASPTAQHLRSRSYAWAGCALNLHGSRFDPGIAALSSGIADVAVLNAAGTTLSISALAAGTTTAEVFGWDAAWAKSDAVPAVGATAPFNWSRFTNREVDGAELRVHWQVLPLPASGSTAAPILETIANAQGRAPRIGTVRLRCVAPTRILSVEEVR